jgi:hypothetical protein
MASPGQIKFNFEGPGKEEKSEEKEVIYRLAEQEPECPSCHEELKSAFTCWTCANDPMKLAFLKEQAEKNEKMMRQEEGGTHDRGFVPLMAPVKKTPPKRAVPKKKPTLPRHPDDSDPWLD